MTPPGHVAARVPTLAIAVAFFCLLISGRIALGQKKPPSHPIDLNTATAEQLEQLPGIGPATANAIVRFREKSGPFRRPEDLLAIHGISKSRFDKLRPYITVGQTGNKPKP